MVAKKTTRPIRRKPAAKKKAAGKRSNKRAPKGTAGKSTMTIGELNAKVDAFGVGALTPSELAIVEKLDKMKARRKRTDLTLSELEELAASGKITTAQIKELSEMRQALDARAKDTTMRPVLSIRERLEGLQSAILDALIEEMTKGRGIARITAAERLKTWSKEEGVGSNDGADEVIEFMNPLAAQADANSEIEIA